MCVFHFPSRQMLSESLGSDNTSSIFIVREIFCSVTYCFVSLFFPSFDPFVDWRSRTRAFLLISWCRETFVDISTSMAGVFILQRTGCTLTWQLAFRRPNNHVENRRNVSCLWTMDLPFVGHLESNVDATDLRTSCDHRHHSHNYYPGWLLVSLEYVRSEFSAHWAGCDDHQTKRSDEYSSPLIDQCFLFLFVFRSRTEMVRCSLEINGATSLDDRCSSVQVFAVFLPLYLHDDSANLVSGDQSDQCETRTTTDEWNRRWRTHLHHRERLDFSNKSQRTNGLSIASSFAAREKEPSDINQPFYYSSRF